MVFESDRRLRFTTKAKGVDVIRVRSFDVATFIAFGAAHMGVAGSDVLMEFDHPQVMLLLIWVLAAAAWLLRALLKRLKKTV